ncbi:MAG TPA: 50S ribosomal protein L9 [Dictyoglomaceae bacterium]|nr:50S ribosomal protein L9 [Dictyoglomaceae bacterium]HOL38958.1 50S ribosomal protein L9 [Dictyoglomaceae bacterium]HOP94854.1 50S ribosomal protein L9 [Dictyoglomaceae bacterium]HPP15625.1 50S ribosomal protein L9 [Dictyoglomaceae bacterium]HPU43508.1 50S ribosomal protein L9 [Dictyoglomaceae bacterium]
MKKLRVLLLKDVNGLGKKGEVVDVNDGYARNFLFPKGLAQEVSEGMLEHLNLQKLSQQKKEEKVIGRLKREKEIIEKEEFVMVAKVGEKGKLFGSITNKDIADVINQKLKLNIEKKQILLEEPIKSLGEYEVEIRLHPQITAKVKIVILPEER